MVCSLCKGTCGSPNHNKRRCPMNNEPLIGLADFADLFKEPKTFYEKKKVNKICSICGIAGHNKRTCVLVCRPCIIHADMPTKAEVRVAATLSELLC